MNIDDDDDRSDLMLLADAIAAQQIHAPGWMVSAAQRTDDGAVSAKTEPVVYFSLGEPYVDSGGYIDRVLTDSTTLLWHPAQRIAGEQFWSAARAEDHVRRELEAAEQATP